MNEADVRKAVTAYDLAQCVQIRTLVFVVGQHVPPEREIDDDEEQSIYFLAHLNGKAVGTVRWRREGSIAKIERLAVREDARGRKIAHQLTQAVLEDIDKDKRIETIKIGAQNYIMPFYAKFGFIPEGPEYLEAGGIPHHNMIKTIKRST